MRDGLSRVKLANDAIYMFLSRIEKGIDGMPDTMARFEDDEASKGRRGVIYFVQAGENGPIKIGYCRDLKARLHGIQTGCPERLSVLGVMGGTRDTETEFHQRFAKHIRHGEWFNPAEEIIEFTNQLAKDLPSEPAQKRRILAVDPPNLIEVMAIEIGVPSDTIRKWRQRGIPHYRREELRDYAAKQNRILTRDHFDNFKRQDAA